ncbi:MAG: enoyl-CoA hydratase family protein [Pseudomonadota bacterium]
MSAKLLTAIDGPVLTATINDPPARNAITREFYELFKACLDGPASDPAVRAMVLTGAEGFFCAGGNVHGLKERTEQNYEGRRGSVDKLHEMIEAMRAFPKPIIAAVEGGAAGAGASLALACDLIVAAKEAYVSVAYVKIGLTPDGGATHFLGRALPRHLVTEMVWTGDRIGMERLHVLGVVNRLTESGAALAEAQSWAAQLATGPQAAMAKGKALIHAAPLTSMSEQLAAEADGIATALGGVEAREGIDAFLEKRRPDWS